MERPSSASWGTKALQEDRAARPVVSIHFGVAAAPGGQERAQLTRGRIAARPVHLQHGRAAVRGNDLGHERLGAAGQGPAER